MVTRENFLIMVRKELQDPEKTIWTDTNLIQWANAGMELFVNSLVTDAITLYTTAQLLVSSEETGITKFILPTNYLRFKSIFRNGKHCYLLNSEDIQAMQSNANYMPTINYPMAVIWENAVLVYPEPTPASGEIPIEVVEVKLWYVRQPMYFSIAEGEEANGENVDIPSNLLDALIQYITGRAFNKDTETEKGNGLIAGVQNTLQLINARYNNTTGSEKVRSTV